MAAVGSSVGNRKKDSACQFQETETHFCSSSNLLIQFTGNLDKNIGRHGYM